MSSSGRKSPTIDDLRVKMCWICREEETRDGNVLDHPSKSWVHPCSCTLVAHQQCLLEWIKEAQAQPSRRENALKCPQCGTKYIIRSRNPILLRMMERIDQLVSHAGKFTTIGIITGVCTSFATSVYGLCTLYGAQAVRIYIGDRLYNELIGGDPQHWDWKVYLNFPFVPLYLILSHTHVFDDTLFHSATFPLLLSFCFPPSTLLAASHRPMELPEVFLGYPPSPWVCAALYPIIRMQYFHLRDRLKRHVLDWPHDGTQARQNPWVLDDNEMANEDEGNIVGDIRFDVNIHPGDEPAPQQQNAVGANAQDANPNGHQPADRQAQQQRPRRVRLTFSSLGKFIGTALATPWIAKYMGSLLEIVARNSTLLRRVLAMEMSDRTNNGWTSGIAPGSDALARLRHVGIPVPGQMWDQPEPVWWRNTIGLGLWIVAKDAVSLLHLFLRQRELKSRRILSRSFAGIDVGTLDLISPSTFVG